MSTRILIAGFQHETNTFAPTPADYDSFLRGEGFPALVRGAGLLDLREVNIPAGGFIQAAEQRGWELQPVIWAGASPSAPVTREAYERIAGEIVDAARRGGFDGIYLDLHGAMVAEHADDGEGRLLARIRAVVGPAVPVVASLDLHANVTAQMLREADALVAFRTYPHVDMAETGRRSALLMHRLLSRRAGQGGPLHLAVRRLPFLIPINAMCTLMEPSRGMYARLAELEQGAVSSLSFAPGFPAADFPECGPVIWGYGEGAAAVEAAVQALADKMLAEEAAWQVSFLSPDEAVQQAMQLAEGASRPVVIADTQDNPGAGGDSNTTGMLQALLRNDAQQAAIGLICDPAAVEAALAAGVGGVVEIALAGTSGVPGDAPLQGRFEVTHLSDGVCHYGGPMLHGMRADVGPVAGLRIGGVTIVVSSGKAQMLDRNLFRIGGIEPEAMKIVVNKSSVHFRADFQGIAEAVLVAKAPGPLTADPGDLPWTRLARGMRVRPLGPAFER